MKPGKEYPPLITSNHRCHDESDFVRRLVFGFIVFVLGAFGICIVLAMLSFLYADPEVFEGEDQIEGIAVVGPLVFVMMGLWVMATLYLSSQDGGIGVPRRSRNGIHRVRIACRRRTNSHEPLENKEPPELPNLQ